MTPSLPRESPIARGSVSPYTSGAVKRAVAFLSLSLLSSGVIPAAVEVRFVGGGSLTAESISQEGGNAVLLLPGGGSMSISSTRIAGVEQIPAPANAQLSVPALPTGDSAPSSAPPADEDAANAGVVMNRERAGGFTDLIVEASRRYEVDAELLRCVLLVESSFDPAAVSPKGAMGLAQLMPQTARELGVSDPFDPAQSVDAAARLLARLVREHGGRFVPALAAYNAGRGAVQRYGGLPPYGETIRYVEKILSLYHASPER